MRVASMVRIVLLLCASVVSPQVRAASELRELYRGARATAMGGAFVGLADDEQSLYMNPAGLAGIEKTTLRYLELLLELPSDITQSFSALSNLQGVSGDTLNEIMGKNVYTRAQLTPSLIMPNFGVGLIVDQQMALYAKNKALPEITIGYQTTNGFQAAMGFSVMGRSRKNADQDLRIGVGGKLLWRRGGYRALNLSDLFAPSLDTLQDTVGVFGKGYGFDVGVQYLKRFGQHTTLSLGSAFTEIGNVTFDSGADPVKQNLSAGAALKFHTLRPRTSLTVAYDYQHILDAVDWHMHHHLGVELDLPVVSLYAGLNQFYLTYGASFNVWLLKLTALSYSEELSSIYRLDTQPRYLLKFEFNLNL